MHTFDIELLHQDGAVVAALVGELDIAGAPRVAQVLEPLAGRYDARQIVLDCGRLTFLDPAGLAALVRLGRALGGGPLRLRAPRRSVLLVLEHTGIRHAFEVVDQEGQPVPW